MTLLRRQTGFTLIEAMVTVAVLAILAGIAMPSYSDYMKRGKLSESFSVLTTYSLQLGQFYQDNRSYLNACATLGLPTSANFDYSCTTQSATAYVVRADGKSGTPVAGFAFTLDNTGARTTPAAPTSWPTSTACWIASKAGSCQ